MKHLTYLLLLGFSALFLKAETPTLNLKNTPTPAEITVTVFDIYEGLPVANTAKEQKINDDDVGDVLFLIEPAGRAFLKGYPLSLKQGASFRKGDKVTLQVENKGSAVYLPQVGEHIEYTNYKMELYRISSRMVRITSTTKDQPAVANYDALNGVSAMAVASGYELGSITPMDDKTAIVTLIRR